MSTAVKTSTGAVDPARRAQIVRQVGMNLKRMVRENRFRERALASVPVSVRAAGTGPFAKVGLEVTKVVARQITREFRERGDEMRIGGVIVDPQLNTTPFGPFNLGQYTKDGEVKAFDTPMLLSSVPTAASFPAHYGVAVMLVEEDGNGTSGIIPDLLAETVKQLKDELVAGATGSNSGGGVLDAAKDFLEKLKAIFDAIDDLLTDPTGLVELFKRADETFPAQTARVSLAAATNPFGTGTASSAAQALNFVRDGALQAGKYEVSLRWTGIN
jgi:hypothetical protein